MKEAFIKNCKLIPSTIGTEGLSRLTGFNIVMPFYHTVSNSYLPHVKSLYHYRNEKEFENELDFLLKHFEPLSLEDLIFGNYKKNKKYFYLSFDDGLSEVYNVIEPILTKKGVPASFFVNSAFVDNKKLFFKFKTALILERIRNNKVSSEGVKEINNILSKSNLKSVLDIQINDDVINKINYYTEIDFTSFLIKQKPYLSLEQIQSLEQKGYSIGAHSENHPYFNSLTYSEMLMEVENSIKFVKNNFNQKYTIFSFPFTDFNIKKMFFDDIEKIVDVSFGTAGIKKDSVLFNYQRIPMESYNMSAEKILNAEFFYYYLSRLLGKHIIKR